MRCVTYVCFGFMILAATGAALAQDCDKVPPAFRAKCEEAMRVKQACAGKTGEELKTCQQQNVHYDKMMDCSQLAGPEKQGCEMRRAAAVACQGKAGAELEACIKTQAAMHH